MVYHLGMLIIYFSILIKTKNENDNTKKDSSLIAFVSALMRSKRTTYKKSIGGFTIDNVAQYFYGRML